jgi:hypothetical protein
MTILTGFFLYAPSNRSHSHVAEDQALGNVLRHDADDSASRMMLRRNCAVELANHAYLRTVQLAETPDPIASSLRD